MKSLKSEIKFAARENLERELPTREERVAAGVEGGANRWLFQANYQCEGVVNISCSSTDLWLILKCKTKNSKSFQAFDFTKSLHNFLVEWLERITGNFRNEKHVPHTFS